MNKLKRARFLGYFIPNIFNHRKLPLSLQDVILLDAPILNVSVWCLGSHISRAKNACNILIPQLATLDRRVCVINAPNNFETSYIKDNKIFVVSAHKPTSVPRDGKIFARKEPRCSCDNVYLIKAACPFSRECRCFSLAWAR